MSVIGVIPNDGAALQRPFMILCYGLVALIGIKLIADGLGL